jgi:hypothetical protein
MKIGKRPIDNCRNTNPAVVKKLNTTPEVIPINSDKFTFKSASWQILKIKKPNKVFKQPVTVNLKKRNLENFR